MDVFAVAMRTLRRHGSSPVKSITIRDRKLLSLSVGMHYGIAPAQFRRAAHLDGPRVPIAGQRERESTPPPALVAGFSPFSRHSRVILCAVPDQNCSLLHTSANFVSEPDTRNSPNFRLPPLQQPTRVRALAVIALQIK